LKYDEMGGSGNPEALDYQRLLGHTARRNTA